MWCPNVVIVASHQTKFILSMVMASIIIIMGLPALGRCDQCLPPASVTYQPTNTSASFLRVDWINILMFSALDFGRMIWKETLFYALLLIASCVVWPPCLFSCTYSHANLGGCSLIFSVLWIHYPASFIYWHYTLLLLYTPNSFNRNKINKLLCFGSASLEGERERSSNVQRESESKKKRENKHIRIYYHLKSPIMCYFCVSHDAHTCRSVSILAVDDASWIVMRIRIRAY